MQPEESGRDHRPHIPSGTPKWLIPALTIAMAAAALISLVIAATYADGAAVNVLLLVSGLVSLVVTVRLAQVWRQGKGTVGHDG
jgi:hypothetical protein